MHFDNLQDVTVISGIVVVDHISENGFSVSPFPPITDGLAPFKTVNLGLGFVEDLRQIHALQDLV